MAERGRDVRDGLERRTDRIIADLREEWDADASAIAEPIDYGPKPWYPDAVPDTVDEQLRIFGGMASVVTFYTDRREEAVLVYSRGGYWELPGGVVEDRTSPAETAVREAREESGLDVALTDLLYAGRVRHRYDDGGSVTLPVATFVGRRVDGSLRVERGANDHPGVTRGVGLFGSDVLPENCRDRDRIGALLADDRSRR